MPTMATSASSLSSRSNQYSLLGEGGGPAAVVQEPGVAVSSPAAAGGHPPVTGGGQVGHEGVIGAAHDGADGDGHLEVGTRGTVLLLALPVGPARGSPVGMVPESEKGGLVVRGDEPHVAPAAAVAAVGTAARDMGFASERHAAGATVTGLHVDLGLVYEPRHELDPT
jgi:hypothetical protein